MTIGRLDASSCVVFMLFLMDVLYALLTTNMAKMLFFGSRLAQDLVPYLLSCVRWR